MVELVRVDHERVGEAVVRAAEDRDRLAGVPAQAAGRGERLEERPAPHAERSGMPDGAEDRYGLAADLFDRDENVGPLDVLREQGRQAVADLVGREARNRKFSDERQIDRPVVADAPRDVQVRNLRNLDLDVGLGPTRYSQVS